MTSALVGLIILQTYWLESAYNVKEDHFSQQVNQALSEICKRAEERETVVEISNEIFSLNNNVQDIPGLYRYYNPNAFVHDTTKSTLAVSKESILINKKNNQHTNTKITIVSGDSIVFNKVLSKIKPDHFSKTLTQNDIGKELVNKKINKTLFVEKIMNKLMNYNEDLSKRIDKQTLQAIIESELRNHNINLSFEFAVKDKNGKPVYSSSLYNNEFSDVFKTQLFPNDFFSSPNYLLIYFPKKDKYIVTSLGLMGSSSILLTLIVIFSYTLTLFIILRQKKLSEMKNDFVNNMTHELKTPISTISLASQMLKDKSISENQKNFDSIAQIIEEESKRLGYQVEKVLQMAILERGSFKFRLEYINVKEFLNNIYNSFIIQVKKRNGTLTININSTIEKIEADEIHLSNVILNLLENAIKYCQKEPNITIFTKDSHNGIIFSVKDNGIGISSDDQKRIFEKFYRVHTGNVHNVKGFGLGLSYVKAIADAHQGWIKVESELNVGSEFFVYIPLKQTKS
jgi:two-component system phosphate regulon sensor histidine kinase PhoR